MHSNETPLITRKLTATAFQRQIFQELLDFLKFIRIKEAAGSSFEKREPTKLLQYYKISELYIETKEEMNQIIKNYPKLKSVVDNLYKLLDVFKENDSNALILLDAYMQFSELK